MSVGASDQPARDGSKRASYVPRYAARQFAATTTTTTNGDDHKDAMKRAKTVKERPKPSFEAGPRSINPKQLQARLSIGMSETEAMSSAVAAPSSGRPDLGRSNSTSSVEKNDKKQRRSRKDRSRSDAAGDLKPKRSVRRPAGPPREIESSENTMTTYQPGDAAKRKAEKRSSQAFQAPPARPLGYVAEYSLQFTDLQAETAKALMDREEETGPMAMRPTTLRPQDRPNWTQQSQCGDDMRHALGANWRRRKSAGDRNAALQALEGSSGNAAAPPPRKSTSGAMGQEDQTLISDAVKQINREKKSKRRQSVMALFRKL
ncbi:hypothetical protein KC343_g8172 [Hortaea werneckii]|uniref:Uncharacterized protein n=1 Tax=Hortaea werneckii TaxID=91943 RepID=A0A3M7EVL9_HORWE|nr:hypothetical protein KC352_g31808 [Hortaea werneckii]KAI7562287.1 hypothetical protein KC317_g8513 [Hortaea werneckii]KAI7597935.1 hypothetical protein KC346_g14462 [Hortaea werneckii]KAI7621001.1 hypothetical protein KC343_g8172 [Hortaea werneckii]KAI7662761.1 hypothetical protein KC319_g7992 [Hortaea werneckii]